jgi:hypothetical protein
MRALTILKTFALVSIVVGLAALDQAQQNGTYKVKSTPSDKVKKPAPIGKVGGTAATASSANARDLQSVERENAKAAAGPKAGGKKNATALKPVKDKPNPPINFGGTATKAQTQGRATDPSKGRLREKHARH